MSETVTNVCTLGEIRMVGFGFAPSDWMICDGSTLAVSTNPALFSILGNAYGGNGVTTFMLPDLLGRVPVGNGTSASGATYYFGAQGGYEEIKMNESQLPAHTHAVASVKESIATAMPCSNQPFGNISDPSGNYPSTATAMYSSESVDTEMAYVEISLATASTTNTDDPMLAYLGNIPVNTGTVVPYAQSANEKMKSGKLEVQLNASLNSSGSGIAHDNMQPYGVVCYIICIEGYCPLGA